MDILFLCAIGITGFAFVGLLHIQNKELTLHRHTLSFEFLPKEFDGFTIVHLSDLHNKRFGTGQRRIVDMVRSAKPDIIVMTGDMIDRYFYYPESVFELVIGLRGIAPMYYVTGNHEWLRPERAEFLRQLAGLGVVVLDNRVETIVRRDRILALAGIDDFARHYNEIASDGLMGGFFPYSNGRRKDIQRVIDRALGVIRSEIDERAFKILLVHRPELIREYMHHNFNLIFSGHAHGGQWNLPWIGPIFAPGQGMFPRLVSGVHWRHGVALVISRGLGNSGVAFQRLFNKPEVVVVVLKKKLMDK